MCSFKQKYSMCSVFLYKARLTADVNSPRLHPQLWFIRAVLRYNTAKLSECLDRLNTIKNKIKSTETITSSPALHSTSCLWITIFVVSPSGPRGHAGTMGNVALWQTNTTAPLGVMVSQIIHIIFLSRVFYKSVLI